MSDAVIAPSSSRSYALASAQSGSVFVLPMNAATTERSSVVTLSSPVRSSSV
ncbi:MAG: hypothetical protein K0S70_2827 [Microbacterium sp.]|nr:hypothetical protein [Microbacterium sp.]